MTGITEIGKREGAFVMDNTVFKAEIKRTWNHSLLIIWYAAVFWVLVFSSSVKSFGYSSDLPEFGNYEVSGQSYRLLFSYIGNNCSYTALEDGYYYTAGLGVDHGFAAGYDTKTYQERKKSGEPLYAKGIEHRATEYTEKAIDPENFKEFKKDQVLYQESYVDYRRLLRTILVLLLLVIVPIIIDRLLTVFSKRSSLTMTETGVSGKKNILFLTKDFEIPFEKISDISCAKDKNEKSDIGRTVKITSDTGTVSIPWVTNADEFVEAVSAKISPDKAAEKE